MVFIEPYSKQEFNNPGYFYPIEIYTEQRQNNTHINSIIQK